MNCLEYLVEEIHSTVLATVDENGFPVTCAVDMMDYDENGLYFLTASGKNLYNRLKKNNNVSLTGMKGEDTLSCVAVSVFGKVEELGSELIERLVEKNSYMKKIYPTEQSRHALVAFRIYEGSGEFFDLSKRPVERKNFVIGGGKVRREGYYITDICTGCKKCRAVCPQGCIDYSEGNAKIVQKNCLRCGNCMKICPEKAVIKRISDG